MKKKIKWMHLKYITLSDSPYRKAITGAILKMSEEGKLHKLKTRWWKEKGVKGIFYYYDVVKCSIFFSFFIFSVTLSLEFYPRLRRN